MSVAREILNQLGGNKFAVMTGAKQFMSSENSLQFSLPANFATNKINRVIIKLDANDTYSIKFYKITKRGLSVELIEEVSGIYCDMLQDVFTMKTGLDCSLGSIVRR